MRSVPVPPADLAVWAVRWRGLSTEVRAVARSLRDGPGSGLTGPAGAALDDLVAGVLRDVLALGEPVEQVATALAHGAVRS